MHRLRRGRALHSGAWEHRVFQPRSDLCDGSVPIALHAMKHVASFHTASELLCVAAIGDLQYMSANIVRMRGEESLDEVPINTCTALKTKCAVYRDAANKIAEGNASDG